MQIAIVGAGYTRRRGRQPPARHGGVEAERQARTPPRAPPRRASSSAGSSAEFADAPLRADPGLRRVRLPREPRRELRAPRVRELVAQGAPPGGVRGGAREQPADGVLLAEHHPEDAQRHGVDVLPVRVDGERLGLHAGAGRRSEDLAPGRGSASGCAWCAGSGRRRGSASRRAAKEQAFASVEDLTDRARLDAREVELLAEAGALEGLVQGRREAMWKVQASRHARRGGETLFAGVATPEELRRLRAALARRAARPRLRAHRRLGDRPPDGARPDDAPREHQELTPARGDERGARGRARRGSSSAGSARGRRAASSSSRWRTSTAS